MSIEVYQVRGDIMGIFDPRRDNLRVGVIACRSATDRPGSHLPGVEFRMVTYPALVQGDCALFFGSRR